VSTLAAGHARFAGWGLAVARAALDGPVEVAVVGAADDPRTAALHRQALLADVPGLVVALGRGDSGDRGSGDPLVPRDVFPELLEGRGTVDEAPAAYVCKGFTCRMPVTTVEDLRAELTR
jgi:uncharacterized protein YyaL (SSP411 family)